MSLSNICLLHAVIEKAVLLHWPCLWPWIGLAYPQSIISHTYRSLKSHELHFKVFLRCMCHALIRKHTQRCNACTIHGISNLNGYECSAVGVSKFTYWELIMASSCLTSEIVVFKAIFARAVEEGHYLEDANQHGFIQASQDNFKHRYTPTIHQSP